MQTDGNCYSGQGSGDSLDEEDALANSTFLQANAVAVMPVEKKARYYKMDHEKRGLAVIFNHKHFTVPGLEERTGTQIDCKNLKLQLERLRFHIVIYNDLDCQDVQRKIIEASNVDYTNYDCFLLSVLSHGNQGVLFARNGGYETESLWSLFTADNVPTLAGKPKMFFIQACHDQVHREVALSRIETDSSLPSYKIPAHADFLIVYSTISGSGFVQALCQELETNGFKEDLLTLLTFVCQRIALNYENSTPPHMHALKQVPSITSMLTRRVKFTDH